MDISVVVPLYNEVESLPELNAWIDRVMKAHHFTYEIWFIDDGSTDGSWKWFEETTGDVVITMDADLQDSPDEIPELYRMIKEEGYDLVSGWKKKRFDPLSKKLPSKLYNATASSVTGIKLHDFNCGLKAYRNEVVKSIEVYGEMHRYSPYFYLALTSMILGTQLFLAGFLGELISRTSTERNHYLIDKKTKDKG